MSGSSRPCCCLLPASALLGLALVGCAAKPVERVAVTGTVQHEGRTGLVTVLQFWPQDRSDVRMIEVPCSKKGEFDFSCPPGRYKVTASPPLLYNGEPDISFPADYTDPHRTPLEILVPETGAAGMSIRIGD